MADKPRRIPASELSAYERWELPTLGDGKSAARGGSEKLKPLTADDLERIRKDAYDDGFKQGKQEGFETGRKEGREQGRKEGHAEGVEQGKAAGAQQIKQSVDQLAKVCQALTDPLAEQQHHVEQAMLNVALAVARSVIHRELHQPTDLIQQVLLDVMAQLPKNATGIRFEVNPADHDYVMEALGTARQDAELVSNPKIHPGGCMVVTSTQQLDFTVEKRFQKVVHEMLVRANESSASQVPLESPDTFDELSEYPADLMDAVEAEQKQNLKPEDDASASAELPPEQNPEIPDPTDDADGSDNKRSNEDEDEGDV